MENREIVLSMKGIQKSFHNNLVLKEVSFSLKKGEILALLGENGAGKSTLMKILSGQYPAGEYEGVIQLNGRERRFSKVKDAQDQGIAIIPQEISLELDLSVAENIFIGCIPKRRWGIVHWGQMYRGAREILAMLGMDMDVGKPARALNASLQQIVCIARALASRPKILILDEPTAALTSGETEKLFTALRRLKEEGISCIYISHKLEEVLDLTDRLIVLRDGRFIAGYDKAQYDADRIIEDIIGKKLEKIQKMPPVRAGEEALRVQDLVVQHPANPQINIVDGISFSLHKGEVLGLAGLVGAGRTECLRAIYGSLPKKAGSLWLNGVPLNIKHPADALKQGVAMLTEDRKRDGYIAAMNIRSNMTLCVLRQLCRGAILSRAKEKAVAERYFARLAVKADSIESSILSLSGGNQQKVLIGKCLAVKPGVLLLDEPTKGVDVGAKNEIYNIIMELAKEGMGIIVVSSELSEMCLLCSRALVLAHGKLVAELSGEEMTEANVLGHIFKSAAGGRAHERKEAIG